MRRAGLPVSARLNTGEEGFLRLPQIALLARHVLERGRHIGRGRTRPLARFGDNGDGVRHLLGTLGGLLHTVRNLTGRGALLLDSRGDGSRTLADRVDRDGDVADGRDGEDLPPALDGRLQRLP